MQTPPWQAQRGYGYGGMGYRPSPQYQPQTAFRGYGTGAGQFNMASRFPLSALGR
jgi:hypothetical protein